jgi:HK97 family phage major capsid protein
MDKMWIKLIKNFDEYEKDDVLELDQEVAKQLINLGVAEETEEPETDENDVVKSLQTQIRSYIDQALAGVTEDLGGGIITRQHERVEDDPKLGFKSLGDFAMAVKSRDCNEGLDDRLKVVISKAPQGQNTTTGEEGGLLVPPEFSTQIRERVYSEENLINRVDEYTIQGNSMSWLRVKENSRADGSRWGGVQAYWVEEGNQLTKSQTAFERMTVRPKKLAVLIYATDEMMSDSPIALEQYLTRAAGREIGFKTSDSMINGDGVGKPLGILNSDCLVSVAKESGQAADTVVGLNVMKMWSRLHPASRSNAIWIYNQDVEVQLWQMKLETIIENQAGDENVGGYAWPVYLPPGGLSDSPYATIMGRPAIPMEWLPALGDKGDLILADWSQYAAGVKGGIKAAMSIHLRFDYDETAFRFTFRVDGQPWWPSALTPYKGSNTTSPFVTLAERA